MGYVLIALLGVACGVLLTWYLLVPIVTLVAVAAGVAGALRGQPLGEVLSDTVVMVCILEASWIATVFVVARRTHRRAGRSRISDPARRPSQEPSEREG